MPGRFDFGQASISFLKPNSRARPAPWDFPAGQAPARRCGRDAPQESNIREEVGGTFLAEGLRNVFWPSETRTGGYRRFGFGCFGSFSE